MCIWKELKALIFYILQYDNYLIAVFIDIEEDEKPENKVYSRWSELPDLALEQIFSYLSIREKYYASLVCRSWYNAFLLPYPWYSFTLEDTTLTRARFNYYCGWQGLSQYVLDHLRAQMCLTTVGKKIRKLTIKPMLNFYNLYEFMNMVSWYTEQSEAKENVAVGVGKNIEYLKFTFPCNMESNDDSERIRLFGTGGKLLEALKKLMENLKQLKRIELIDLMLDAKEAQYLLDGVCNTCGLSLETLYVVNTTRIQYPLLHVGVFLNLKILVISPQNLGDDVVELLGNTNLEHLHILQNRYSPSDERIMPVSYKVWRTCRNSNPNLNVHLQLESHKDKPLIWQDGAPVKTILYDSPHIGVRDDNLLTAIEFYKGDLRVYGHKNIPRFFRSKKFEERIDSMLMLLVRECPKITTLVITERISTSTVLLLASTAKNLKSLYIRGNAVIIKCDWPYNPDWSREFYSWVKANSKSYQMVEQEVSQILGYKWKFLTDKEFRNMRCNIRNP